VRSRFREMLLKSFSRKARSVRLRPMMQSDEALFHTLYTDPETMRFVGAPWTPAEAVERFRATLCRRGKTVVTDRFFVIEEKSSREAMGICGSSHYDRANMRVEVGVMLLPLGRRAGVGRGALMALVDHLFEEQLLVEVYARIVAGHSAAENLVKRASFLLDMVVKGGERDVGERQWSVHRSTWRASQRPAAEVIDVQRDRFS